MCIKEQNKVQMSNLILASPTVIELAFEAQILESFSEHHLY